MNNFASLTILVGMTLIALSFVTASAYTTAAQAEQPPSNVRILHFTSISKRLPI